MQTYVVASRANYSATVRNISVYEYNYNTYLHSWSVSLPWLLLWLGLGLGKRLTCGLRDHSLQKIITPLLVLLFQALGYLGFELRPEFFSTPAFWLGNFEDK